MAVRGKYQKQMAAFLAAAKTDSLNLEDILPEPMLDHLQDTAELKAARVYTKELEDREKELQAANDILTSKLEEKLDEIRNLPGNIETLKVDWQHALHQVAIHKMMSDDACDLAEHYRYQLKKVVDKKQDDSGATDTIRRLQTQVGDLQNFITNLVADNRNTVEMVARLRESDAQSIEMKDKALAEKDTELANKAMELTKKDELLAEIRKEIEEAKSFLDESDNLDATIPNDSEPPENDSDEDCFKLQELERDINLEEKNLELEEQLLAAKAQNDDLEAQLSSARSQLTHLTVSHEQTISSQNLKDKLVTAALGETKTLSRCYYAMLQVMNTFNTILKTTSAYQSMGSADIVMQLDEAQDALEDYSAARQLMPVNTEMLADVYGDEIALRKELEFLAKSATDSQIKLEDIVVRFWGFLDQLSSDPKLLSYLNGKLCQMTPVTQVIDLSPQDEWIDDYDPDY
jgi:CII-binding regulator of phage lambda lysogenization HflD